MGNTNVEEIKLRLHCLSGIINVVAMVNPNPIDVLVARFLISKTGQEMLVNGIMNLAQQDEIEGHGNW